MYNKVTDPIKVYVCAAMVNEAMIFDTLTSNLPVITKILPPASYNFIGCQQSLVSNISGILGSTFNVKLKTSRRRNYKKQGQYTRIQDTIRRTLNLSMNARILYGIVLVVHRKTHIRTTVKAHSPARVSTPRRRGSVPASA